MTELGWYSRLAVWAGVIVLVVQSVAGHSSGVVTAIAVVLLTLALPIFLYTLFRDEDKVSSKRGDASEERGGEADEQAQLARDMESVSGA